MTAQALNLLSTPSTPSTRSILSTSRPLLLVALVALTSCTVVPPPGWPADAEPSSVITATPGVMYGFAPLSWDLPDGRVARVDVDRCRVGNGMGGRAVDMRFDIMVRGEPSSRIQCQTDPMGPSVPETRFGCWTTETSTPRINFWMAPEMECDASQRQTLTRPSCWDGEVRSHDGRIALVHGYLESAGAPVGRVSWVSDRGPLLAADIVVDQQVRLYDLDAEMSPELRDRLLLFTIALSWWEHAASS